MKSGFYRVWWEMVDTASNYLVVRDGKISRFRKPVDPLASLQIQPAGSDSAYQVPNELADLELIEDEYLLYARLLPETSKEEQTRFGNYIPKERLKGEVEALKIKIEELQKRLSWKSEQLEGLE